MLESNEDGVTVVQRLEQHSRLVLALRARREDLAPGQSTLHTSTRYVPVSLDTSTSSARVFAVFQSLNTREACRGIKKISFGQVFLVIVRRSSYDERGGCEGGGSDLPDAKEFSSPGNLEVQYVKRSSGKAAMWADKRAPLQPHSPLCSPIIEIFRATGCCDRSIVNTNGQA